VRFIEASTLSIAVNRLDRVEIDRDQWQRPAEVLQALDLRDGTSAVDLGSGAGYFALKLS
jgi:predicted methyltransferase